MDTKQAKELGQKLIFVATEIDGLQDFKNSIESQELELAFAKKTIPCNLKMAAFLNEEDSKSVKDFTINLIDKRIKLKSKELELLIP